MNFKKIVSIALCSLMLVGCSQDVQDKKYGLDKNNPVSLTVGTLQDTSLENLIDDFNSTIGNDRGIVIQYTEVSSNDELSSMDMVSTDYNTIYSLCANGNVAELSSYFSALDLGDTYLDTSIEDISFSGLKAIPTKLDINVLALNKSEWESFSSANNLDTSMLSTWDGVLSVAETYYNSNDSKPFLSVYSGYDMALEMSNQNSVPIVSTKSDSASINLSSEAMQNIWDKIATPQIKGYFVYGGLDTVQDNTTIASYCKLSELSNNNDILVLQAPFDNTPTYKLNTTAMAINSTDDTKVYAGVEFIKWLTSTDINYKYALNDACIPANKECQKTSNMKDYLYNENVSSSINASAELLAVDLLQDTSIFKVSPFDNISTLQTTLDSKINQSDVRDTLIKRIKGGVLETKAYEGILDSSSFKTWYDDICTQLRTTFGE